MASKHIKKQIFKFRFINDTSVHKSKHSTFLQRIDFEPFKDTYRQEIQKSIDFIGRDLNFFTRRKAEILLEIISRNKTDPSHLTILDVGCGVGLTDYFLAEHFKKLYGVDLSRGIVQKAAALNPRALYKAYSGKKLPYPSNSIDITFAICVMHHVLPSDLDLFLSEMLRVTRENGLVIIFEHNPFNPLTKYAVSRCILDKDTYLLRMKQVTRLLKYDGAEILEKKYIFFTPFDMKPFSILDRFLGWLPLGAQYFVAARK